jgi:hypothetical protein
VITRRPATATDASDEESDDETFDWWHLLVADAETASSLAFADVEGVDRARRFLADTDFSSASVYVEQHAVPECYDQRLCWIRWTGDRIETDYAIVLRDADVACEVGAEDVVAYFVRLPVALDPDEVRRFSSGSGGGHCRAPEGGRS